jgi:deazaflavin-dependent oxidoreductase (nitroreductase family)
MSTSNDQVAPLPSRPARGTLAMQRPLNALMRLLLRSPVHGLLSSRLLTITVIGRKTGNTYKIPVAYVEHEGALLVGTAATWRRNLRADTPVRVRLRGRDQLAHSEVITDEEQLAVLYRAILPQNPVHGRFVGIGLEPDGEPNRTDLRRAMGSGLAVVRLRLV